MKLTRPGGTLRAFLSGGICFIDVCGVVGAIICLVVVVEVALGFWGKYIGLVFERYRVGVMISGFWRGGLDKSTLIIQEVDGPRRLKFVKRIQKWTSTYFAMIVEGKWFDQEDMVRVAAVLTRGGIKYWWDGEQYSTSSRLIVDCNDDLGKAIRCATLVLDGVLEIGPQGRVRQKVTGRHSGERSWGWDEATLQRNGLKACGRIDSWR